jgi:DNA-binding PadR family transcriptional regulator
LYNLEAKGLIAAEWRTADNARDRKYYALTPKGRAKLAADTAQWSRLAHALGSLGVLPGHAGGHTAIAGGAL